MFTRQPANRAAGGMRGPDMARRRPTGSQLSRDSHSRLRQRTAGTPSGHPYPAPPIRCLCCGFRSRGTVVAGLGPVRSNNDVQAFLLDIGDDVSCVRLRRGSPRAASREGGIDAEDRAPRRVGGERLV
jgi:hypothetical protein